MSIRAGIVNFICSACGKSKFRDPSLNYCKINTKKREEFQYSFDKECTYIHI